MTSASSMITATPPYWAGPIALRGAAAVASPTSSTGQTAAQLSTVTTSSVVRSVPAVTTTAGGSTTGSWIGLAAVLLAAAVVAGWNVWLARRRSREEERSRQRTAFAEAFKAYARYRELPYAIRRRRADDAAAERVRLSDVAREIQAELTYHQTWMDLEDPEVAAAYCTLVTELRQVAGGHMRDAWTRRAIKSDSDMNMVIEMGSLPPLEDAYRASVRQHLQRLAPWWCR